MAYEIDGACRQYVMYHPPPQKGTWVDVFLYTYFTHKTPFFLSSDCTVSKLPGSVQVLSTWFYGKTEVVTHLVQLGGDAHDLFSVTSLSSLFSEPAHDVLFRGV